jgi:hypothetical protein
MKCIRQIAVALVMLSASMVSQAANYDMGTLNIGYNGFGPNSVADSFLDKIKFTLDGASFNLP